MLFGILILFLFLSTINTYHRQFNNLVIKNFTFEKSLSPVDKLVSYISSDISSYLSASILFVLYILYICRYNIGLSVMS